LGGLKIKSNKLQDGGGVAGVLLTYFILFSILHGNVDRALSSSPSVYRLCPICALTVDFVYL